MTTRGNRSDVQRRHRRRGRSPTSRCSTRDGRLIVTKAPSTPGEPDRGRDRTSSPRRSSTDGRDPRPRPRDDRRRRTRCSSGRGARRRLITTARLPRRRLHPAHEPQAPLRPALGQAAARSSSGATASRSIERIELHRATCIGRSTRRRARAAAASRRDGIEDIAVCVPVRRTSIPTHELPHARDHRRGPSGGDGLALARGLSRAGASTTGRAPLADAFLKPLVGDYVENLADGLARGGQRRELPDHEVERRTSRTIARPRRSRSTCWCPARSAAS